MNKPTHSSSEEKNIFQRKQELFHEVGEMLRSLSSTNTSLHIQCTILKHIALSSLEDALAIIQQTWTSDQKEEQKEVLLALLSDAQIQNKYAHLEKKLFHRLQEYDHSKSFNSGINTIPLKKEEWQVLSNKIDTYYKDLWQTRKFRIVEEQREVVNKNELLFDYLQIEKRSAEKSYYAVPALKVLCEKIFDKDFSLDENLSVLVELFYCEFEDYASMSLQDRESDLETNTHKYVLQELQKKDNDAFIALVGKFISELCNVPNYFYEGYIPEKVLKYLCSEMKFSISFEEVSSRLRGHRYMGSIANIHRKAELISRSKRNLKEMGMEVERREGQYEWKEQKESTGEHFIREEIELPEGYFLYRITGGISGNATVMCSREGVDMIYAHIRNGKIVSKFFKNIGNERVDKCDIDIYWDDEKQSTPIMVYSSDGHTMQCILDEGFIKMWKAEGMRHTWIIQRYEDELLIGFREKGRMNIFSSKNTQNIVLNSQINKSKDLFLYRHNDQVKVFVCNDGLLIDSKGSRGPCTISLIDTNHAEIQFFEPHRVVSTPITNDYSHIDPLHRYKVAFNGGMLYLVDQDSLQVFMIERNEMKMYNRSQYINLNGLEIRWMFKPEVVNTDEQAYGVGNIIFFQKQIFSFPEGFEVMRIANYNGSLMIAYTFIRGERSSFLFIDKESLASKENNIFSREDVQSFEYYPKKEYEDFLVYKDEVYMIKIQGQKSFNNRIQKKTYILEKDGIQVGPEFLYIIGYEFGTFGNYLMSGTIKDPLVFVSFDETTKKYFTIRTDEYAVPMDHAEKELSLLNFLSKSRPTTEEIDHIRTEYFPSELLNETAEDRYKKKKRHKVAELITKKPEYLLGSTPVRSGMNEKKVIEDCIDILLPEDRTTLLKKRPLLQKMQEHFKESIISLSGMKGIVGVVDKIRSGIAATIGKNIQESGQSLWEEFSSSRINDGDPLEKGKVELMRLSSPVDQMFADGLMVDYDPSTKMWSQGVIPVEPFPTESLKKVEVTIPIQKVKTCVVPKPIRSRVVEESIRVNKKSDYTVETNRAGFVKVHFLEGSAARTLSYTLEIPEKDPAYHFYSMEEYTESMKNMEDEVYASLTVNLASLPLEYTVFIKTLEDLSPSEKMTKILSLIHEIGFYDMHNGEVNAQKMDMSLEERIVFMYDRMTMLKRKNKEAISEKQYAGVCADFAFLATILLRKAGLCAGILNGVLPQNKTIVNDSDAHGISFVVWPSEKKGIFQIIPFDATPGNAQSLLFERGKDIRKEELQRKTLSTAEEKKVVSHIMTEESVQEMPLPDLIQEKEFIEKYDLFLPTERIGDILSLLLYGPKKLKMQVLTQEGEREQFKEYMKRMLPVIGDNEEYVEPEKALLTIAKEGDMTPSEVVEFLRELKL